MARYERPGDADERVNSALAIIEAILPLEIDPRMNRKFLSNCLWQVTQAEGKGKYDIRYRSEASIGKPLNKLRHDHVTRRKVMVDALLENPADAWRIAKEAIGCVVTKKEHQKLAKVEKAADGWERYRLAGIAVRDLATDELLTFSAPPTP
jgi:hypothetical protein